MVTIADFIKIPKTDSYNHLKFGMRYFSFVHWAGFFVPDFPENGICCDEDMRSDIQNYISTKTATADDVQKLLSIAISEAISDTVKNLDAMIDFSLAESCGTPDNFIETIKKTIEKYSDKVEIRPFLSFNIDDFCNEELDEESLAALLRNAGTLMKSGYFSGFDFCGNISEARIEKIKPLIRSSRGEKLPVSVCCDFIKSSEEFLSLFEIFKPSAVCNFDPELCDENIQSVLKKKNVIFEISPELFLSKDGFSAQKAAALKKVFEGEVVVKLCSGKILYTNSPISSFATELCNTGAFSKEELSGIL